MIRLASSAVTPSSRLIEPELSAKGPPITNVPLSMRASMNSACASHPGCSRTPPLVHVGPGFQTTTTRMARASAYGRQVVLEDAVAKVRHEWRLENSGQLEAGQPRPNAVEQSRSVAQQHRGEVNLELVYQAGVDALVDRVCTARDRDVLLGRGGARIFDRALDAVGDEGEGGSTLHGQRLARVLGQDEHRNVGRGLVAPPTLRTYGVLPGTPPPPR